MIRITHAEVSMEECCGNCIHYDYERDVCTYYPDDELSVHDYDECQIKHSIGCFEAIT